MKNDDNLSTVIFFQPTAFKFNLISDANFEIETNLTTNYCDNWDNFQLAFKLNPEFVVIHESLAIEQNLSYYDLIKTIRTIAKLNDNYKNSDVKIVLATNELIDDKNMLTEINSIGNLWVSPTKTVFNTIKNLSNSTLKHYQTKTVAPVETQALQTLLYLRDEMPKAMIPKMASAVSAIVNCNVDFSVDWSELLSKINSNTKYILLHINAITRSNISIAECLMMLSTVFKCNECTTDIPVGVIITKDTDYKIIKVLQKNNISCVVPAVLSWGVDEAFVALDHFSNGKHYYPKHIINTLPGSQKIKKTEEHRSTVKLTERQHEVFELIAKRGLSNKQIAKVLKISESTVKIHVSSIFKTLCVRNRTQLALTKL